MNKILMINTLPIINFGANKKNVKNAGNQTLLNTLKGYSENNFEVRVITFNDVPKEEKPFKNVTVTKSKLYSSFKFLYQMKQIIKKKNNKNRNVTTQISREVDSFFYKYWNCLGTIEIDKVIRKFKPDVLYGYEIYSTRIAKKLGEKYGLPVVTRFQGTELGFFIDDNEAFWKAKDYIKGTEVDSDLIIMANDGTDGDMVLKKLGNYNSDKVKFWVNGLHEKDKYLKMHKDKNYREEMKIDEDSFIICTANRFVDWKRIDRIINCVEELTKRGLKVTLIAIGDGPEMEPLKNLVNKNGLKNVKFLGALPHSDTIYHILNADLYITLNHSGNLGNSILEALALGTPVCTLKNHSVSEVLTNDYNAMLVDNVEDVTESIVRIYKDKNIQEQLSINGREYARKNLDSWRERMNKEAKELKKIIEEKKKNEK